MEQNCSRRFLDGALIEEEFESPQTIMNVLKDLESMFGILDIGRQVPNQGCHNMIKITRDEFCGTTAG